MKQLLPRATGREIVRTGCAHLLGMRHGRGLDALSVFSITLLMYAGSLKSAALLAWMPVDLTAVALGLVGLSVLMTVVECRKLSLPPVGGFVILASLIPGFLVGPDNPYTPKAQLGICISIYTALAAFVLLGSRERRKMWLGSLAVLGLVVIPLLRPGPLGTLSVGGSGSTISAAQMLGVSVVILVVLVMTGRVRGRSHLVVAAMILGVLLYALLGTGSRGPTLAAAVALMVTVVLLRPDLLKRAAAAVALVVVMGAVLGALGFAGIERMRVAASGSFGDSPRVVLWEQAVQAIPGAPTGFGWGNFWSVLSPEARLDSGFVQYPHNTVLEAFVLGGWFAGLSITALLVLAIRRYYRLARVDSLEGALLAIAVFYVFCAMVSGTIADDRAMYAVLAAAFAYPARRAKQESGPSPEAARPGADTASPGSVGPGDRQTEAAGSPHEEALSGAQHSGPVRRPTLAHKLRRGRR